jgi:hypothetical protein
LHSRVAAGTKPHGSSMKKCDVQSNAGNCERQCFSRLHGCNTYTELLPGTKTLNPDAIAALK